MADALNACKVPGYRSSCARALRFPRSGRCALSSALATTSSGRDPSVLPSSVRASGDTRWESRIIRLLLISTAIVVAAIAPRALAQRELSVSVQITPAKPHGGTAEVDVRVFDMAHKPVAGASVTICASMPGMRVPRFAPRTWGMAVIALASPSTARRSGASSFTLRRQPLGTGRARSTSRLHRKSASLGIVVALVREDHGPGAIVFT